MTPRNTQALRHQHLFPSRAYAGALALSALMMFWTGCQEDEGNPCKIVLSGDSIGAVRGDCRGEDFTGKDLSSADVGEVIWGDTVCPDGTNSDGNGGSCNGHLSPDPCAACEADEVCEEGRCVPNTAEPEVGPIPAEPEFIPPEPVAEPPPQACRTRPRTKHSGQIYIFMVGVF